MIASNSTAKAFGRVGGVFLAALADGAPYRAMFRLKATLAFV
jgi:hypothetical protein